MTTKKLWQLVEQWRKDNQPLLNQLAHLKAVNDLQRKLQERKDTTDRTGPNSHPARSPE